MKKDLTTKDTILASTKSLLVKEGLESINIRMIAKESGIATGTIYNYFTNKDDILLTLTEDYWDETLKDLETVVTSRSFTDQLREIYSFLFKAISNSAGLLMNSLQNIQPIARKRMFQMQEVLRQIIERFIKEDIGVKKNLWTDDFTLEKYTEFIIMNIMMSLRMNSPNIDFFLKIIQKTLY